MCLVETKQMIVVVKYLKVPLPMPCVEKIDALFMQFRVVAISRKIMPLKTKIENNVRVF